MSASAQYYTDRIAQIDLQIAAYEAAILSFATNGAQQSYSYDTGQQTVRVERQDASSMQAVLDSLMNRRQILCQRAGLDSGVSHNRGAW